MITSRVLASIERLSKPTIAVCLLVIVGMEYVRPWIAVMLYGDKFRAMAAECDTAMHDEVVLRPQPTEESKPSALELSGAVELTVCHRYDKLQKRLLVLGVSQDQLSLWSLEALESEAIPITRMVTPHQMDHL
jgi:hypothetical protein